MPGKHWLLATVALCLPVPALAQEWAVKMFPDRDHSFGTVARYAKTEHQFVFTNPYVEDVHVADARASCGCTSVEIRNATVKTHQQGSIVARFNTRAFLGQRGATITVTLDRPFPATVQLHVRGTIRDDVAVNPGQIEFGTLDAGTPAERWIAVAGRPGWKITGVRTTNPSVTADVATTKPGPQGTTYEIRVRAAGDLPEGFLRGHLLLATNDPSAPQLPIAVEGQVTLPLSVSPADLFIGELEPGQQVTRQVVVRGRAPFRILGVSSEGKSVQVNTSAAVDSAPKPVHVLPLTFTATGTPGKVQEKIRITTDLGRASSEFNTIAVIQSPNAEQPVDVGSRPAGPLR